MLARGGEGLTATLDCFVMLARGGEGLTARLDSFVPSMHPEETKLVTTRTTLHVCTGVVIDVTMQLHQVFCTQVFSISREIEPLVNFSSRAVKILQLLHTLWCYISVNNLRNLIFSSQRFDPIH